MLPRSLFGRALTILLVPLVLLQLVVGLVFFQRHYLRVSEQMTRTVGHELAFAVANAEAAATPEEAARRVAATAVPLLLRLDFVPGATVEPGIARSRFDFTAATVGATLAAAVDRPVALDVLSDPRNVLVSIGTDMGALKATVPRDRLSVSNPHQLLVLMVTTSIVLATIAVLFLRNQVKPIRALAEAAEAFGKGRSAPFRPAGAEEVRRAGLAFLAMRARIERQIDQRTQMLSGVSHDLRTPLTRMKLTLALMDESDETRDLMQDADQMDRMIGEFLAFARGDSLEDAVPTDPVALVVGVVEDARRAGAAVELVREDDNGGGSVQLRPLAVRRALQNLVGNAARHGTHVLVTVRLSARWLTFVVEDDGPGIAEADRARALQAFTRLDAARTPVPAGATAGVGLGLTIAMDVARGHGGTLELGDSAGLGGLKATLRLPR